MTTESLPGVPATEAPAGAALAEPDGLSSIEARSQFQIVRGRFLRHRVGVAAAVLLFLLILMTIVYPMVSPFEANAIDSGPQNAAPGWPHIFGTGPNGEDLFVDVWFGGRTSILVGIAAALAATFVGALLGAMAGYLGKVVDSAIVVLTDIFLAAPALAVIVAIATVTGDLSLTLIVVVIAALTWMQTTRLVRAEFISLKEREFVLAARAAGASPWRIMIRHLLPNAVSVIVVSATLLVAAAIILEATISFLGVGLPPLTNPSWGNLINRAQEGALTGYWWGIIFPGTAIALTCLCVNFVGDAFRDALDPHAMESGKR